MDTQITTLSDRRSIPSDAREFRAALADGHRVRRLDWPEPACSPHGSLLFLPGQGDTYEKYLEAFEHWRRLGWRISSADWRGQAGSGRFGSDDLTVHLEDFSQWIGDLAELWGDWASGRDRPLVLAGHSMGGHLVLRAAAEDVLVPRPDAMVLSAPMLDVVPEHISLKLRRLAARTMRNLGDRRRPAWKWHGRAGAVPLGRQARLTHDDARYADEMWWRDQRPELCMGAGSWSWVVAALDSIALLRRPGLLESMDVPILVLAAERDRLVGIEAIRRAVSRLPDAELVSFGPESAHEILREADPVRDKGLAAIDSFLERRARL